MIIETYKFLHDHYNKREDWKFVHYFVYNLTYVLAVVFFVLSGIGIFTFLISAISGIYSLATVAKVTGLFVIAAVLFLSIVMWIEHETDSWLN